MCCYCVLCPPWFPLLTLIPEATDAVAILSHFGLDDLVEEFIVASGVHNLGNLLSFEPNIRTRFDNLNLWFENIAEVRHWTIFQCHQLVTRAQVNRYRVCVSQSVHEMYIRRHDYLPGNPREPLYITFSSSFPNSRLPCPILLGLHAACARVAHMSGAAEVIDELERDVEETRVLAFDGSSARLLDHLMTPFATIPEVP